MAFTIRSGQGRNMQAGQTAERYLTEFFLNMKYFKVQQYKKYRNTKQAELSSSVQRPCQHAQLHSAQFHTAHSTAPHTELCCCCPNYARRLIFSKPGILKHLKGAARFPRFSVFTHILCSLETLEGEHTFFGICADFLYLCLKLVFCVNCLMYDTLYIVCDTLCIVRLEGPL